MSENTTVKTNEKKYNSKEMAIAAVACLSVLVIIFALIANFTKEKPVNGVKSITVDVVYNEVSKNTFYFDTDAEYLSEVLEKATLIEGEDGEFGIFVTTVNGITADTENEEWWRFSRNGEVLNTGIDKVAVKDGDSFAIELIVGYENY